MTLIVGIEHEGGVYLGADTGSWFGEGFEDARDGSKIFQVGPLALACAGALRVSNIVRHCLPELPPLNQEPEAYLVSVFVPMFRQALLEHGSVGHGSDGYEKNEAEILIGCGGKLFRLSDWFCVFRNNRGYSVAGHPTAKAVALGVLAATPELPPHVRIGRALEIAADHTDAVRKPFDLLAVAPPTAALAAA